MPTTVDPVPGGTAGELRRIVLASMVGTALEWYDFFIFGMATAMVFSQLFFPSTDRATAVLLSFATFGVAFLFRPLGGLAFGLVGDRVGRRATLVLTTLLMGFATGAVGLLPTYAEIGLWAPVLLVIVRVCQGLAAGAEFGGAATLLAEHAPPGRRGFYASFVQTGVQIGLLGSTLVFLLIGQLDTEDLLAWGWRLPFLGSFLLIFVSLYLRLRIAESPVFLDLESRRATVARPVRHILRHYRRNFLVGVGAHIGDTTVVYVYTTFLLMYLPRVMPDGRAVALTGIILFTLIVIVLQPCYGALSDRIGRRPLNLFAASFTVVFGYPLFLLVDTGEPALIWLALVVATAFGFAPAVAVQPAFYAELFGAGVRYTGFAASREVGAAVSGFSPLIAAALLEASGNRPWLVAGWIVLTSLVSLVAFLYSRETRDVDIAATEPAVVAPLTPVPAR